MARDGVNGSSTAERSPWFWSSETQQPPEGDQRYRVNPSAKFYIATLVCGTGGCTLAINESGERVRKREKGVTVVRFENQDYQLRPARDLKDFVKNFVARGVTVYVGGLEVPQSIDIEPFPFIYVVARDDFTKFQRFYPK